MEQLTKSNYKVYLNAFFENELSLAQERTLFSFLEDQSDLSSEYSDAIHFTKLSSVPEEINFFKRYPLEWASAPCQIK
jgi:hypothetical protein